MSSSRYTRRPVIVTLSSSLPLSTVPCFLPPLLNCSKNDRDIDSASKISGELSKPRGNFGDQIPEVLTTTTTSKFTGGGTFFLVRIRSQHRSEMFSELSRDKGEFSLPLGLDDACNKSNSRGDEENSGIDLSWRFSCSLNLRMRFSVDKSRRVVRKCVPEVAFWNVALDAPRIYPRSPGVRTRNRRFGKVKRRHLSDTPGAPPPLICKLVG